MAITKNTVKYVEVRELECRGAVNGERCWLRRDSWQAAHGYSASGTSEYILSFEDGVKLFLERGVFEFRQPD